MTLLKRYIYELLVLFCLAPGVLGPLALAEEITTCEELLSPAGGIAVKDHPGVWEIRAADLLILLQSRQLDHALSAEALSVYVDDPRAGVLCYGRFLFIPLYGQSALLTVDWHESKRFPELPLSGLPTEAWFVIDSIYAMNLFFGTSGLEGAIVNVVTAEVLYFAGPARFGDHRAVMVSGPYILFEDSSWGSATEPHVFLYLYEIKSGQVHDVANCPVIVPRREMRGYRASYLPTEQGMRLIERKDAHEEHQTSYLLPECRTLNAILLD